MVLADFEQLLWQQADQHPGMVHVLLPLYSVIVGFEPIGVHLPKHACARKAFASTEGFDV